MEAEFRRHKRLFPEVDFKKDGDLSGVEATLEETRQAMSSAAVTKCEWKVLKVWEKDASSRNPRLKRYVADLGEELKQPWQRLVNKDLVQCIEAAAFPTVAAAAECSSSESGAAKKKKKKKEKKAKAAKEEKKEKTSTKREKAKKET